MNIQCKARTTDDSKERNTPPAHDTTRREPSLRELRDHDDNDRTWGNDWAQDRPI